MSFGNKAFIANRACEGAGPGVSPEMRPEVAAFGEELIALEEGALECALTAFLALEFDDLDAAVLR